MAGPSKPRKPRASANKKAAAKAAKQAAEAAAQSVAVPAEVFNQIMSVLGNLPYVQVAGLLQTIQQTAKQGVYDEIDPASGVAEAK